MVLDSEDDGFSDDVSSNPQVSVSSDQRAYVIYTSGSTGVPKGVEGTHRASMNRFSWMWKAYPFKTGEVCCQKTNLGFRRLHLGDFWPVAGRNSKRNHSARGSSRSRGDVEGTGTRARDSHRSGALSVAHASRSCARSANEGAGLEALVVQRRDSAGRLGQTVSRGFPGSHSAKYLWLIGSCCGCNLPPRFGERHWLLRWRSGDLSATRKSIW